MPNKSIMTLMPGSQKIPKKKAVVGVKTGGSRVGVPNCASRRMVTGDKGHDVFIQVRDLSMEVKPYSCLINIDDMGSTRVDLPRDQRG